jgi:hypothetical protein
MKPTSTASRYCLPTNLWLWLLSLLLPGDPHEWLHSTRVCCDCTKYKRSLPSLVLGNFGVYQTTAPVSLCISIPGGAPKAVVKG